MGYLHLTNAISKTIKSKWTMTIFTMARSLYSIRLLILTILISNWLPMINTIFRFILGWVRKNRFWQDKYMTIFQCLGKWADCSRWLSKWSHFLLYQSLNFCLRLKLYKNYTQPGQKNKFSTENPKTSNFISTRVLSKIIKFLENLRALNLAHFN